jgi:hypothetical protein
MGSIERARGEVQAAFARALVCVDAADARTMDACERELWTLLLALGRALITLFLVRAGARPRDVDYVHGGMRWRLDETRTTPLGTRFGKVQFERAVGRDPRNRRAAADYRIDRELGLCSGFTLSVVLGMTRLCTQMAFETARTTFRSIYEWAPGPRALMRMIDAVGSEARDFLENAPPPADDGEILVIQVDGRGAPMISSAESARRRRPHRKIEGTRRRGRRLRRRERPRKRRTKGKKSKNSKLAIVGVLYTLSQTPHGLEGPIGKRLYATFESHEALFIWLRKEADKRGYGRKYTLFLGDGSPHIWRNQAIYFPKADVCIDWWHIVERLWKAGACLFAEGSEDLSRWIAQQTKLLRRGSIHDIMATLMTALDELPKRGRGNKERRERLNAQLDYFGQHAHRMRYHLLRRRDLDIGTGAAEGAVRNLIAVRFDGPGMRWSRDRAERLLHLRCIALNGQWDDFAAHLAKTSTLTLLPAPIPTRAHDAKAAA